MPAAERHATGGHGPPVGEPLRLHRVAGGVRGPHQREGAVALGADGLLVEVHPNPAEALSDGQQQVDFHAFRGLIEGIQPFLHATGRTL